MGQLSHDSLPDAENYCYSYLVVIFRNTAHNNAMYIIMHMLFYLQYSAVAVLPLYGNLFTLYLHNFTSYM